MLSRPDWLPAEPSSELMTALIYSDFSLFCQVMFKVVSPGIKLKWVPYLNALCSILQEVAEGRRKRVIITLPPRHLKSFITSVALPAFILGRYRSQQVLCISYGQELAGEFAQAVGHHYAKRYLSRRFRRCAEASPVFESPSHDLEWHSARNVH